MAGIVILELPIRNLTSERKEVGELILKSRESKRIPFTSLLQIQKAILMEYQEEIRIEADIPQEILDQLANSIPNDQEVITEDPYYYYQKKIFQQTTEPTGVILEAGDLWIDLSVTPYVLKRYNGLGWVVLGSSEQLAVVDGGVF